MTASVGRNIRVGSTRTISAVAHDVVSFEYHDTWSVFDRGPSPQKIPTYGACRTAMAVKSFEHLHGAGIRTHFIEQVSSTRIHVREVEIPGEKNLTNDVCGKHTSLEWLARFNLTGSLWERYKAGTVTKEQLGFKSTTEVCEGIELPCLRHDCSTKFEPVDKILSVEEARSVGSLSTREFNACRALVGRSMAVLQYAFSEAGYDMPDGKLELAISDYGEPMVIDVAGNIDENRIIHRATGELYSKDRIRKHPVIAAWKKELDAAKKLHPHDKTAWPEYPQLSEEDLSDFARAFQRVTYDYTGVRV